ncbi:MAG: hypothetical protein LBJ90_04290 [Treponema sp.]|jgi:hypothetical protein|nr:hypothetical protein [Treponema sp.]
MTAKQSPPSAKKTAKAGKKPSAKAASGEKDGALKALARELSSLIPQLDAGGLRFLIDQARIHLYNLQVDRLNEAAARSAEEESRQTDRAGKSGGGRAGAGKNVKAGKTEKTADLMRLEKSESGSSFYIVYRGQWIMFSRAEITGLVNIVLAPVTDLEVREHLFDWLERERRDVFATIPIADKFDGNLKSLTALLKKNFR